PPSLHHLPHDPLPRLRRQPALRAHDANGADRLAVGPEYRRRDREGAVGEVADRDVVAARLDLADQGADLLRVALRVGGLRADVLAQDLLLHLWGQERQDAQPRPAV